MKYLTDPRVPDSATSPEEPTVKHHDQDANQHREQDADDDEIDRAVAPPFPFVRREMLSHQFHHPAHRSFFLSSSACRSIAFAFLFPRAPARG